MWVKSFLSWCILPAGTCSQRHTSGQCSGTLLFIIIINEVVDSLFRMLADDTKLFRTINIEADSTILQNDLTAWQKCTNKWQLKFNADKCKVLHIGGKNPKRKYCMIWSRKPLELHQTKLEKRSGYPYRPWIKLQLTQNKSTKETEYWA